jgi:tetratricopeptide (TPR) repeat protein
MRRLSIVAPWALLVASLTCGPEAVAVEGAGDDELAAAARAIDARPDAEAYDVYAGVAFKLKRWDEAIARLKQGTARLPGYHAGVYKLAYAYRQKKDFAAAADAYRKFATLEPTRSDTWFGLGAALQGAGDRAGAIVAYKHYVDVEKAPEKRRFVEQARDEIERLEAGARAPAAPVTAPPVAASPTPARPTAAAAPAPEAIGLRAQAEKQRQAGRLDEASATFERALAADPGNLDLHVELGDVYFAQKRYQDAARVFRAAVERDAGYALGWYNLAHAEARAGEHAGAVRAYREYIRLRPSDPDPYYGLGQTCKTMGDTKGAIDAFRTYLQMERRPESQRWVDKARRELEALEGNGPRGSRSRGHDLKNPFADRDGYASNDDLLPPGAEETRREHERIAREIAADDILPIDDDDYRTRVARDLKDPFGEVPTAAASRDRLARYASALAAYRAALDRQANEVAAIYQRGAERVLANDLRGAQRMWSQVVGTDRSLDEAKARLERAREQLLAK